MSGHWKTRLFSAHCDSQQTADAERYRHPRAPTEQPEALADAPGKAGDISGALTKALSFHFKTQPARTKIFASLDF